MKTRLIQVVAAMVCVAAVSALGASSASATGTKLCAFNQTPCGTDYTIGTELKMSLASGTKLVKETGFGGFGVIECTGASMNAKTTTTGGETTSVEANVSSFSFTGCTNSCTRSVVKPGKFVIENVSGTMNAVVRWTGFEFTENCGGEVCTFGSEISKGLFLRGGSNAVLKFERAVMPRISGGGLTCMNSNWNGTLSITSPAALYVAGPTSESILGAGVLCMGTGSPCPFIAGGLSYPYPSGTSMTAQLKAGITSVMDAGFPIVKCEESAISGEVLDSGSSTQPIVGNLSSWTFGKCNCKVQVPKAGRFSVDWTSGNNGALTLSGFEITTDCGGKECSFGSAVSEGVSLNGGSPALIVASSASVPKKSGIAECNSTAKWNAEYEVTTAPKSMYVREA